MVQLEGILLHSNLLQSFDNLTESMLKAILKVPDTIDKAKALLDARYSFIENSKLPPGFLKGSGLKTWDKRYFQGN